MAKKLGYKFMDTNEIITSLLKTPIETAITKSVFVLLYIKASRLSISSAARCGPALVYEALSY